MVVVFHAIIHNIPVVIDEVMEWNLSMKHVVFLVDNAMHVAMKSSAVDLTVFKKESRARFKIIFFAAGVAG